MFPAEAMAPGQRPASQQQQRRPRPPMIVVRSMHADQRQMEFAIACLLGYWHHEHDRLVDPDSPGGTILLPRDPGVITLLHQYAIALLCLARDCPVEWKCHCNAIRARFNAPPPDHELPTGQFTLAELGRDWESGTVAPASPAFPIATTMPGQSKIATRLERLQVARASHPE